LREQVTERDIAIGPCLPDLSLGRDQIEIMATAASTRSVKTGSPKLRHQARSTGAVEAGSLQLGAAATSGGFL
jgi:hypothetical protein